MWRRFINDLVTRGESPTWRFIPGDLRLRAGGTIKAVNIGGEFHTFTEVAAFGGGCIDEINQLLGLTPVAECAQAPGIFMTTGLAPRQNLSLGPATAGTHRYMCLIHPWMRTTALAVV